MDNESILPFIEYVRNCDLSNYPRACEVINPKTDKYFIDIDNDFRVGNSGGFLMDMGFTFVNTNELSYAANIYDRNIRDAGIVNWVNSIELPVTHNKNKLFYCPHLPGTTEYIEFWRGETKKRRNGIIIKGKKLRTGEIVDLHITGDHYNYLNYSRILRPPNEVEKEELLSKGDHKTTMVDGFPNFWDGDYWNFKIDFFIAKNNYHLAKGKARGKGYSYKRGSQGANTINLVKDATVILAAYDLAYLTDPQATSDMVKHNLDWFENHTHWKRGFLSESLDEIQLGFKTTDGGNKTFGMLSKVLSVSLRNNESAAIGKRAIEIDFEESGKCPNLQEALGVTLSSTEVGATNVGTIRVYGTAGTKESNWAAFSKVFFNPNKFFMMPFENIWDYNARHTTCGFFHPQVWNMHPYMDIWGNSMLEVAYNKDLANKDKVKGELTNSEYVTYVGQRANTPQEAFKVGGDNLFVSPELLDNYAAIISGANNFPYRDGILVETDNGLEFRTNTWLIANGQKDVAHEYIEDVPFDDKKDIKGCIREWYPPKLVDGIIPNMLYYVVLDPFGKDKKSSLVINKNSLASIYVLTYPNDYPGIPSDTIVAAYSGRPDRMEDVDKILLKLCTRYNAKALVEVDRGETVSNFRKWRTLNYLSTDPTVILSDKQKENMTPNYGINIGSGSNAEDGLIYLKDWLYTIKGVSPDNRNRYVFHYIPDKPLHSELIQFSIEGNFDRISAMRLAAFQRKAMQVKRKADMISSSSKSRNIYQEINLYNYNKYGK